MPQKSPSVITLNFKPPALRWLLLLPALLALFGAGAAVRWYVGNTVAEYSPSVDEGGIEMARMAVRWAPADPLTHWRLASFEERTFSAENLAAAVREYQLAVEASPYDYRYWMTLGRALEAAGDPDSGEKALRRAVELAPAYSLPRWHYGNLLLRQEKPTKLLPNCRGLLRLTSSCWPRSLVWRLQSVQRRFRENRPGVAGARSASGVRDQFDQCG